MSEAVQGASLTLEEVHTLYYGELVGFARKKLRAAHIPQSFIDPEDVVGNAFVKACRDPARIEQPRAYLFQIVRREILEHTRRARHYEQAAEASQTDLRLETEDFSDVTSARCDVHHALAGLPAQQRAAVWATKGLGWTQAEYAQTTQKRPGTVAVHISRAVAGLKSVLVVATFVAATFGCAAGGVTLRRYTAASRAGRPRPKLVPDVPPSLTIALVLVGVAYLGMMLAVLIFLVLPALRSRLSLIRHGRGRSPKPPPPGEPPGDASGASRNPLRHCAACGEVAEFRRLTEKERKAVYEMTGNPDDHALWACTTDGCLAVRSVMGSKDMETMLLLPEQMRPQPIG